MVKDSRWKNALSDPVEVGPIYEYMSFGSSGSETPWIRQVYRALFRDNGNDEGSLISPRSALRMRAKREEVSFCNIKFE